VDVMRDITGSDDVKIWGSCSGGITMSALSRASRRARRKEGPQRHRRGLPPRHGRDAEHDGQGSTKAILARCSLWRARRKHQPGKGGCDTSAALSFSHIQYP
jgi:hypothetical protein